MDVKTAAAAAVVLVAVWESTKAYQNTAPKLSELRETVADDTAMRQQLLDADITIGGITLVAAGAIWYASGSPIPAAIMLVSFAWISTYHHLVQKGMTSDSLTELLTGN